MKFKHHIDTNGILTTTEESPEIPDDEPFTEDYLTALHGATTTFLGDLKRNDLDEEVTPEPSPELWDDPDEDE